MLLTNLSARSLILKRSDSNMRDAILETTVEQIDVRFKVQLLIISTKLGVK